MAPRRPFLNYLLMIANYISFYVVWIGCLWAAVRGWSFFSMCAVIIYLIAHLRFVSKSPLAESLLIMSIVGLGVFNDIVLTTLGVLSYVDATAFGSAWWMIALWACFGSTYWHAFSWLESRRLLACLLGATAVPLCYMWGVNAGAVSLRLDEKWAYGIIAVLWAGILPFSFVMSNYMKKRSHCL